MIRPGIEPGTDSLEGCCSIQLSYRTHLRRKDNTFFAKLKMQLARVGATIADFGKENTSGILQRQMSRQDCDQEYASLLRAYNNNHNTSDSLFWRCCAESVCLSIKFCLTLQLIV